jgi:hypothetical protein
MWLYSVQIPHSWYTYDEVYGNTCFWILFDPSNTSIYFRLSIPSGNYTGPEIVEILNLGFDGNVNNSFSAPCFDWSGTGISDASNNFPMSFNNNNGKITMKLYGGIYTDPNTGIQYNIDETTSILFFDIDNSFRCNSIGKLGCSQSLLNTINKTFGWYLGYRAPSINVSQEGNTANTIVNTFGPKYLIIVIDDYNQNHINNGLVTITDESTVIKLPTYYNPTMPVNCSLPSYQENTPNSILLLDKSNISYKPIPQVVPTAPRTLTQAQIYSINEIYKNNETNTLFRSKAPTNSNIFALIPVKLNQSEVTRSGTVFIEFSGSLKDNKRIYFGPVNLERLRIKLLDDNGNLLNMNGSDWSVTLGCDILYQY